MEPRIKYGFKDVFIVPQYSEITTRSNVDIGTTVGNLRLKVPIISANMDSVTGPEMAIAMERAGGIGALHRFWSTWDNLDAYQKVVDADSECFVSIGVGEDAIDRAYELWNIGARYFIVDIAHGHSLQMMNTLWRLHSKLDNGEDPIFVIAGNVGTPWAVNDLADWGADMVKIGIGPGAACLTKNVTGVTVPQFSAIQEAAQVARIPIIADGGCTEIGDIAKSLGAGADLVMLGRMLASAKETPSIMIDGHKIYRGMASRDAMRKIRGEDNLPTPEGTSIIINDSPCPASEIVNEIAGGLRSSFSYSNAVNLKEFHAKVKFGVRHA